MPTHINIYIYIYIKEHKPMTEKEKKKNQWSDEQYILSKLKNIVAFIHSHNKCYNIFTKHLFSVVIGHSLILLFYFDL